MAKDKKATNPLAPRVSRVTKLSAKAKKPKVKASALKSADLITVSDDEDSDDIQVTPFKSSAVVNDVGSHSDSSEDEDSSDDDSDVQPGASSKEASKKRIEQLAQQEESDDDDDEDEEESTPS